MRESRSPASEACRAAIYIGWAWLVVAGFVCYRMFAYENPTFQMLAEAGITVAIIAVNVAIYFVVSRFLHRPNRWPVVVLMLCAAVNMIFWLGIAVCIVGGMYFGILTRRDSEARILSLFVLLICGKTILLMHLWRHLKARYDEIDFSATVEPRGFEPVMHQASKP